MKTLKLLFIVPALVFATVFSFAQDDVYYSPNNKQKKEKEEKDFNPKKRKINSGYVFIDGKYVEPPYRFKVKGNSLYINKQKACTQPTYSWAIELKKKDIYRAGYPPCVAKDSDWDERKNCKIEGLDVSYDYMMKKYYLKKYKVDVAYDSIVNYYSNYPNVKSFEEFEDLGSGYYKIICYNGYETLYQFDKDNFIKKHSEKKSQKTNDVLEMYSEIFRRSLNRGNVRFFSSDHSVKGVSLIAEKDMFSICLHANSDSINPENVIITRFITNKEFIIKQVLEEYKNNDNLKNRIQNSKKTSNEKSESNTMKNVSKTFDLNNYSPRKSNFVAFFPVDYEEFISNMNNEILSVKDNIEDQGYYFNIVTLNLSSFATRTHLTRNIHTISFV